MSRPGQDGTLILRCGRSAEASVFAIAGTVERIPARVNQTEPARVVVRVTIRPFSSRDIPALRRVALEACNECAAEFGHSTATAVFLQNIASVAGDVELIVADAGGSVVGFVGYTAPFTAREPMFPPEWAVIRMLSISPKSPDRGVDRRLSEDCIARARRDKATAIGLLSYSAVTSALPLYLRLGFVLDRCTQDPNGVPVALFKLVL